MKKIVTTTTGTGATAISVITVVDASIVDVLNPSVPLYDAESNFMRVGFYALLVKAIS